MNRLASFNRVVISLLLFLWLTAFHQPPERYATIDQHAREVPPQYERNLPALVSYLIQPAQNDFQRARALFIWITHNIRYDTEAYFSGNPGAIVPPERLLQQRVGVCQDYATLFQKMAALAGLNCVVVEGWSKGYNYQIGLPMGAVPNHAWNAIQLEGKWYLVDCTWGSGHIDDQQQFIQAADDFYFLPDPRLLILTHFPKNPRWQLLNHAVSRETFEQFPLIRPAFFKLGCRTTNTTATLTTQQVAEFHISTPEDVIITASVVIQHIRGDLIKETSMKGYTFSQWTGEGWNIQAQCPDSRNYIVRLFGARRSERVFRWIADYRVIAQKRAPKGFQYPQQFHDFFLHHARLITPMRYQLPQNHPQDFVITVPNAKAVALVKNGIWHKLNPKGDGRFEGTFALAPGEWHLMARFGWSSHYRGLLAYLVH